MSSQKKIVIIGIDGANKTTAKLVGIKDQLHDFISTIPPYTPPSWTSIITGVNPAKHGIIGWQKVNMKDNRIGLFNSKDVKYPRLSEILNKANLRSVLINLPMTYPFTGIKQKDNTIIVSDWAAPEQAIYPQKLEERYKEYLIDPPHEWAKYGKKEYPRRVEEYTETRLNLYYDLLERTDWSLYFIVFSETDWFSHIFPQILYEKDVHLVSPTFKHILKFIETAKSVADFLFIVSDHGFEVKNKIFYVNSALAENGFIRYSKSKAIFFNHIKNRIPKKILNNIVRRTKVSASSLSYITQSADAFMVEPANWGIYVKDKSKINEIKKVLSKYDEILDVIEVSRIYHGNYLNRMPNLFVIPKKGVEFSHELNGKLTENIYKGDHEIHGIFSVTGRTISEDINFSRVPTVYDITPTILHIFGLPIPNDMDGRVLMEIFEEGSEFAKRKPKYLNLSYQGKERENERLKKAIHGLKLKGRI
ncbi:type I phosphodiesterase/nucleotide pyrophosphatase [Thermococcus sp. 4557]|uniref:alkaline phosphatase family protein n=1 Tax=Thermococcus sp. (strain CGMCC 1.5172 / 4557) TaxID=1042877 RepID=UPI000219EEE3|nr:alkaline phosphatase family protein [Thermococcus sp. 4557]AEK73092.1 type I phosphodiesterase/nucleotide pyrophosphatase [Thermococcus sp. 4557]